MIKGTEIMICDLWKLNEDDIGYGCDDRGF